MKKYVITTDSTCDLPESFTKENNVDVIPVLYSVNDVVYGTPESNMDIKDFYDAMRNGIMPTTMACNIEDCKTVFEKYAKDNIDVLHLAFSSGLSSTYNNAVIAANEIMEEYPNLQLIFEDDKVMNLNENECKMLQQLVSLYLQMSNYEDRKIFFLGARENYFYFKNLGLIKE